MPVQRHNVVIPKEDGGLEVYPLKEWLRQHPEEAPSGLHPNSSTSHQLRSGLVKLGWTMQQTPTEVRLIKPGTGPMSEVVGEILGEEEPGDDYLPGEDRPGEAYFSLESQLRDFLASNLGTIAINARRLRLYIDPTGREGVEYPSAVGPIDILAVDENNDFFVFELKRANSPDKAIGQVARYMGWVQQTIGRDHKVFGVVVAKSISTNLRYAASVFPNVHLFEYEVEFHLRSAHDLAITS